MKKTIDWWDRKEGEYPTLLTHNQEQKRRVIGTSKKVSNVTSRHSLDIYFQNKFSKLYISKGYS